MRSSSFKLLQREVLARGRRQVVLLLLDISIGVDLVENQIDGFVARADLLQGLLHHGDLLLELRVRNVHHMNQQVGFANLVQRRFERLDQFRRQFADKAHRVRKQEGQIVENHLADRGVERGEELVLGENLAFRNQVHQRRFAHVGIADQRHADHCAAVRTLHGHLAVDLLEVLLQFGNAVADDAAVGLDFALSGAAAGSRTALWRSRWVHRPDSRGSMYS